jgi:transmembrane sensor
MSRRRSQDALHPRIIDEAAEWFVEVSTGEPDVEMRRAFDTWLRQSPEHVRAYLEMFQIWEHAPLVDPEKTWTADALIEMARDPANNVIPMEGRTQSRSPDAARALGKRGLANRGWIAFAASIALAAVGISGWLYAQREVYVTRIGEQRLISLPDGSDIELNARSKIRLKYGDRERRIELIEGQALFNVAKDPERPFIVESDRTQVRAVGTLFDVYRKAGGITVTVVEGRVSVQSGSSATSASVPEGSPNLVAAGEQLRVTPAETAKPERVDVAAATAWRARRLIFSATPLTEVADEFNRYNTRQLIVQDANLEHFNVSAVFSATDLDSLLRFLKAQPNIAVEEDDTEIRISEK